MLLELWSSPHILHVIELRRDTNQIILGTSILEIMRHGHHIIVSLGSSASLATLSRHWGLLHAYSASIIWHRKPMLLAHSGNDVLVLNA